MIEKLSSLNDYDHQNQVEIYNNPREKNLKTNSNVLIGDWTIKRSYPN